MDYKHLENNLEKFLSFKNDISLLDEICNDNIEHVNKAIIELSENSIEPDSTDGKRMINIAQKLRDFGHMILNLLEIHISCSFAGITLFTWNLPKIQDNNIKQDNNNKRSKKL